MLELTIAIITAESDWPGWLLALGPVGASAFYGAMWMAYRNTDKSHSFERETEVVVSNLTGEDVKVGENNGTTKRWIQGRNDDKPRQRL
ncbi:hypothetical protein H4J02_11805 [Protaetiibacter sp. SSC-01]|uniref:hypothetical protein n=1 Tax=Protaetiibacter sp. SSC-01 TaxID=2759943 RepID=UPI001656A52E|nr:hypothetical protein [Protaetiibacter sp. SSC-01]QNO37126.1 hypothetical protein H4J02_11805 [Protaetiibacter sp. SSC-01]